jgi:hypothetical protein
MTRQKGEDPVRTVDTIRAEIAALRGELAELSGEPIETWNGIADYIADPPPGGAFLDFRIAGDWVNSQYSYQKWYPSVEAAKAALLKLAQREGRVPDRDGFHVDLTAPGCQTSQAWVTRRENPISSPIKILRKLWQGPVVQENHGPQIALGWTVLWQGKPVMISAYGKRGLSAPYVGEGNPAYLLERAGQPERYAIAVSPNAVILHNNSYWSAREAIATVLPGIFDGL